MKKLSGNIYARPVFKLLYDACRFGRNRSGLEAELKEKIGFEIFTVMTNADEGVKYFTGTFAK